MRIEIHSNKKGHVPAVDVSVSLVIVRPELEVDDVGVGGVQAAEADLQRREHAPEKK